MGGIREVTGYRLPNGEKVYIGYECAVGGHPPVLINESQLFYLTTLADLAEREIVSIPYAIIQEALFVLGGKRFSVHQFDFCM